MKKRKVILSIFLALVLLFTVSIAAACVDNDNHEEEKPENENPTGGSWVLQDITLGGNYKTEYQLNEEFSASGLTVSAVMVNTATSQTRNDNVTEQAKVDSSRFNSAMVGTYVITISYTSAKVTRYANYSVSVAPVEPAVNGITMQKTTVEYNIPIGSSTVKVNVDDITVKAINDKGEEEATPLTPDAYTLTYYNGGQKLESFGNAKKGTYTIQAERKSDNQKAFVIVYVLDPAIDFAFKSGTVTQDQSLVDNMSADWKFTVTDKSGTTHELSVDQVELSGINSIVPGDYSVKASYNEYDGKGRPAAAADFTTDVKYSITKVDGMINQSYAVNFSQFATEAIESDKVVNEAGGITVIAKAGKTKITDNSQTSGTKSFTKRFQFGGKSTNGEGQIKLELKGASLITVYARSGSGNRGLGLYSDASVTPASQVNYIMLSGAVVKSTCLVEKAGTYYLAAPDGDLNIYYVQIDTVLVGAAAEGQSSVELSAETEVSGIQLDSTDVKKDFVVGDEFSYDNLVVRKKIYNPVTADAQTEVVTEGYTVTVPEGSMDKQGEVTVTVNYGGKTATYTINVNSLVDGVNGIKVTLPATNIELDNEDDTIQLNESDVTVTTDSGAAIVTGNEAGQCTTLVIELYSVGETETKLDTLTVGVGTYKVKATATYNNSNGSGTTVFTAEVTFTVKVKSSDPQPISYTVTANDLAATTYSEETTWLEADSDGNSVSITAASNKTVAVDANGKKMDDISFTQRVKLGGTGSTSARSIKITVTARTTITIYAMSSGTGEANARPVKLLNASGTDVLVSGGATLDGTAFTADTKVDGDSLHKIVITVEAGTYYFYSASSGFNVYGVKLDIGQTNTTQTQSEVILNNEEK